MTPHPLLARLVHRLAGDRPHAAPDLVTTGYPSLDRLLGGGLRRGELAVVGGDAGAGTTALVLGKLALEVGRHLGRGEPAQRADIAPVIGRLDRPEIALEGVEVLP